MRPQPKQTRRSLKQLVLVGLMAAVLPTTGCDMAAIGKLLTALGPLLTAIGGIAKPPTGATPAAGATPTSPAAASPGVSTGLPTGGAPTISAVQPKPFQVSDSLNPILARSN